MIVSFYCSHNEYFLFLIRVKRPSLLFNKLNKRLGIALRSKVKEGGYVYSGR